MKSRSKLNASTDWLIGDGEMAGLIRAFDWSKTSLGPRASWSPTLRTMTNFLLANRFPLLLWWGPDLCQIYNDAYTPVLGDKHPDLALAKPFKECWSDVWHILGPLAQTPMNGGPATWMEDILCEVNRHGYIEETHFTISYSAVFDDTAPNGIGGVMATVQEISAKVVAERRVAILRDLGAHAVQGKTAHDACTIAARVLENHTREIPFTLFYLIDQERKSACLTAASGAGAIDNIGPASIRLDNELDPLGLVKAMHSGGSQLLGDLGAVLSHVPQGPWADAPRYALVVPIRSNIHHQPAGFLVAGISARLRFDEYYRSFIELTAAQIAAAVINASAYEEERKRAEALAELDRAKTMFFCNVSHEFRTPLTLLLGPAEEILEEVTEPRQHENLKIIHRNALRLQKLVNTLLDFSRIEAGRMEASYEPTALASFTMELASTFRSAVERAGLRLIVDCEALSEPVYVDRDMWEKIVLNLLSNAFKYTLKGSIEVHLRQSAGQARLTIKDTGIGIPKEELPKIFDRFYRVQGTRARTYEGSGIGLSLVYELVKLHGGKITADSVPGSTVFSVLIPLGNGHLPAERIRGRRQLAPTVVGATPFVEEALRWLPDGPDAEPPPRENSPEGQVLLADDNSDMRAYITRLLSPYYEVSIASNGQEAWQMLQEKPFDLVLTDIMMSGMDGFELLKEIRSHQATKAIPVILLSARAGEESKMEGLEAGADDYLIKPFSAKELLVRIHTRLQIFRVRREAYSSLLSPNAP